MYGLYLDIQTTQHLLYNRRGIPRYVAAQAKALLKNTDLVRGVCFNPLRPFPDFLDPELLALPTLGWSSMRNFRRAAEKGPIAYYVMSPFETRRTSEAFLPPFAMRPEIPLIVTLYDLIPLLRADRYLGERNLAQEYYNRLDLVRQADLVLTISEHTRQDALDSLRLDPERVVTIGAGVSEFFRPPGPQDNPKAVLKSALPKLRKPFIFSVSGAEERKNTEGLIRAFAALEPSLRQGLQLVVACKLNDHFRLIWENEIRRTGLTPEDVVLTDLIPDHVLLALYQSAELFVFPSFYEGFGLVAAEAAACGCPSVLSNTSSLPEIFDHPPACFDPSDTDDMARVITEALTDSAFNRELREVAGRTRHTWDDVAHRTAAALERLEPPTTPARRRPAPRRRRIALVGPFPPVVSGIADYNQRLASELSRLVELDIYASGHFDRATTADGLGGVRRFSVEALGRILNPFVYDAIVYCFGNNHHHHRTYEKALEYPGIAWLHDVQLSGMYLTYAEDTAQGFVSDLVSELYRHRAPEDSAAGRALSVEAYSERGLFLTGEVVGAARGVVVNSELARHMVEIDQGPFPSLPPFEVVPLAVPVRQAGGSGDPSPLFTSFGILAASKAPERLVDALALLRDRAPGARLAFAGTPDAGFDRAALQAHAARRGVEGAVTITGPLTAGEYASWLQRTSAAVQLRSRTDGESSAAVADCIGAGVPVLTNIPSCREMGDAVEMLDSDADAEMIARAMQHMLDAPARSRILAAASEWADRHTFRRTAERLLEFVSSLDGALR